MRELLLYAIKSAFVLALLYLPYMLMLRKEKFFRFNRMMLLTIIVCAIGLPLCNIPVLSLDEQPVVKAAQQQMIDVGIPIQQAVVPEIVAAPAEDTTMSWFTIVSIIYIIGMMVVLLVRAVQFCRMGMVIRGGSLWNEAKDGINIYCHADDVAPFSWLNNIVISKADYDSNGREIILHETGHIRSRHSLDIILLTFLQMLQWWNPLAYIFGMSIRDVHEFEADDYVLRQGVTLHGYQEILIKKAVGASSYTFANNFNHSLIKKRITMMCKKNSNPWRRGRALYMLPVAAVALCAFATPKFITPIEEAVNKLDDKGTPKFWDIKAESKENADVPVDTCAEEVDHVEFKGEDFQGMGMDVENTSIFVDGKEITYNELLQLPHESIESVSVLDKASAKTIYGDNVKNTVLIITTKEKNAQSVTDADEVFEVCEEAPVYKDGQMALMQYFAQNMRYPKLALEAGVDGRKNVGFIVEKDGTLSEVAVKDPKGTAADKAGGVSVVAIAMSETDSDEQINAAAHKALEDEAVRVVKATSGNWEPGKQRGKAVRSRFVLPITFRLQ